MNVKGPNRDAADRLVEAYRPQDRAAKGQRRPHEQLRLTLRSQPGYFDEFIRLGYGSGYQPRANWRRSSVFVGSSLADDPIPTGDPHALADGGTSR